MCICVCTHVSTMTWTSKKGYQTLGPGIARGYKPPDMGARNLTHGAGDTVQSRALL